MNIFELFATALVRSADLPALVSGMHSDRHELSFGELDRRVDAVLVQIQLRGLQPGDRVLLAVPVSLETYIVMLALLKAGMVIMFIDPAHGATRVAQILKSWPPNAVVATAALLLVRFLMPELRAIPLRFVVRGRSAAAIRLCTDTDAQMSQPIVQRSPADSALLTFTSGSTGEPKAVIRTHGFLRQQLLMLRKIADLRDHDREFVAMPMFVLFNLANALTSIIPACDMKRPGRADPRVVVEQLENEKATRIVASPALLERVADYCLRRKLSLPFIRCVLTGGGPVSPDLAHRLKRIAPAATIKMVYGSTEAEPIASIDDAQISVTARRRMRAGAGLLAGAPVAGCDVRIIRSQGGVPIGPCSAHAFDDLQLACGSIGEIVVSGKHVLTGYADAARNRETKIEVEGRIWHRTGDAGYLDSAGMLWLAGRCSAAINDSRGTVYPFQVEYALSALKGVRRAALITREKQRVLVIEPAGRRFSTDCGTAAQCIARYHIDKIVTLRKIPLDRRHDAKIDYPALERLLDQALDGYLYRLRLLLIENLSFCFTSLRAAWRRIGVCLGRCRPRARSDIERQPGVTER